MGVTVGKTLEQFLWGRAQTLEFAFGTPSNLVEATLCLCLSVLNFKLEGVVTNLFFKEM